MEFKMQREEILKGLSKIQGVTGRSSHIPVTANVLISAKGSVVSVLATDLETVFRGSYEAEVISEGSVEVPSRKLYEIIRAFPDEIVTIEEMENKWIKIIGSNVKYDLVGLDVEDFPMVPDIKGTSLIELEAHVLKNMVAKTIYAVIADEGRAHLAGVYFEKISEDEKTKIRMVSTDGHRLSRIDYFIEEGKNLTLKDGVVIPKSGMVEVLKLLETESGLSIGFKDSNFVAKNENESFIVRLIEGEFPDYDTVIPKKTSSEMGVDREAFLMMLKRALILSSDEYEKLSLKIDEGQLEGVLTNPEMGESNEVLSLNYYKGEKLEIGFNPKYLIEVLSSMNSKEVVMKFAGQAGVCILEGNEDEGFLGIVMPMRV